MGVPLEDSLPLAPDSVVSACKEDDPNDPEDIGKHEEEVNEPHVKKIRLQGDLGPGRNHVSSDKIKERKSA